VRTVPAGGMSFAAFWQKFIRIPDSTGHLVCPVPHQEQQKFIEAVDTGQYPELLLHWGKKCAKSFTVAARALHHLVSDPWVRSERLIGISSADEDQSLIPFRQVCQLADRHPFFRKAIRVTRTELIYIEEVREPTGGKYTREHRLRALPRDLVGSHGEPWTFLHRDEHWAESDHSMSEALILDPSRPGGQIVYSSYHLVRAMARAGVPLHDLLERVAAGDPTLWYSFIGGSGPAASWVVCPWITESWVRQQERTFASCPARFRRVVLNEMAGSDDGLITAAELRDAIDETMVEPDSGVPGAAYTVGVDLGISCDWTAVTLVHTDERGKVVVDISKYWRGTPDQPVSLMEVEGWLFELSKRFRIDAVILDPWNSRLLQERLERARVPTRSLAITSAETDRLITRLKGAFSGRHIRLNARHTALLEQLDSIKTIESRSREMIKFAPSGRRSDAASHDDLVFSLALALAGLGDSIGRLSLPQNQTMCPLERENCYLTSAKCFNGGDGDCLHHCPSHQAVRAAWMQAGCPGDVRAFYHASGFQDNVMIRRAQARRFYSSPLN
jgi:hypothetical protein